MANDSPKTLSPARSALRELAGMGGPMASDGGAEPMEQGSPDVPLMVDGEALGCGRCLALPESAQSVVMVNEHKLDIARCPHCSQAFFLHIREGWDESIFKRWFPLTSLEETRLVELGEVDGDMMAYLRVSRPRLVVDPFGSVFWRESCFDEWV